MLMGCGLITKADMARWIEYERADRIQARQIKAEIQKTKKRIETYLKRGDPCYVSISWGKDSVMLAHMVETVCKENNLPLPPLIYLREMPMDNPYNLTIKDLFMAKSDYEYIEIAIDYGRAGFAPYLDSRGNSRLFKRKAKETRKHFGKAIMGIRREESLTRKIRFARWGLETGTSFCPLDRWHNRDVFAYLSLYDLPIHPNYAMTQGGLYRREDLRVDCLMGSQGTAFGRSEWEKLYYGDMIRRMEAEFPN